MPVNTPYTQAHIWGWAKPSNDFNGKATAVPGCDEVEVLYPIQNTIQSNKRVYRKDSMEWNVVQKSETLWRNEIITLRYRIKDTYLKTFYDFMVTNKGLLVSLDTAGFLPFIRDDHTNDVYIISFSSPQNIKPKMYEMSVTYRNSAIIPTNSFPPTPVVPA